MALSDWKIERRRGECAATGRSFADGEVMYSILRVLDGELVRQDVARDAFDADEVGDDAIFWRTRYQEVEKPAQLDLESVTALFLALGNEGDEPRADAFRELRYLLALILMRKRRLKVVKTARREGRELFVLRRPRRKEEIEVEIFELGAERAAVLREVLQRIFDGADLAEVALAIEAPPATEATATEVADAEAPDAEPADGEDGVEPASGDGSDGSPEEGDGDAAGEDARDGEAAKA